MNLARPTCWTLLTLSLVAVTLQPAAAARWFDSLPADDPDTVVRRNAAVQGTQAVSPPSSIVASVAGGVVGAAAGVVWVVASGIGAVASGAGEAWWEMAYMFGMNSTPMPRTPMSDKVSDRATAMPPREPNTAPARPTASEPELLAAAPADSRVPMPATAMPAPMAAAVAASAAPVAAAAPASAPVASAPAAIDPGLLANFVYDRGARRADGSFFVPKPLQRLFDVRTMRTTAAEVPVTLQLAGHIIPDRRAETDVEASLLGRIEPPPAGLPTLGETVKKGQLLAFVVPAVGVVDRSQMRRDVARLTTDIRVETENLEILKQFSFVPFRDGKIYQSEQHLAGLRRERDALLPMLNTQEALRAETDGVISVSTAIPGRIVNPGEKVFEIVNPKLLWIEAYAPDPTVAESAGRVAKATALTPEGQTLALTFIGSGLALQQQSTPILFSIDNPPEGLRVGRPVTVAIQSENRSQRGLPVARDALTIGSDGVQEVWEQSEPEVFIPRAVHTRDLDGRSVLIVDGLKEGSRVVVQGGRLLAQLQ